MDNKQSKKPVKVTEAYLDANGLHLMRYGTSQVVGTVNQVYAFCNKGFESSEGAELERFQNIYSDLWLGKTVVADDPYGDPAKYRPAVFWDDWAKDGFPS